MKPSGSSARRTPIGRPQTRTLTASVCAVVGVLVAAVAAGASADRSAVAGSSPHHADAGVEGEISLRLLDQRFAIGPSEPLQLEYAIDGEIAGVVPPTTTTTTAPTTTSTTTTEPRRTTTSDPGESRPGTTRPGTTRPASTTSPTATTAPASTAVPEPAIDAMVGIAVHQPVVGRAALAQALDVIPPDILDTVELPLEELLAPDGTPANDQAADGSTPLTISVATGTVPFDAGTLTMAEPGLYPVTVYVRIDGQVVATHATIVQRVDDLDAAPTIDVAVLAHTPTVGPRPDAEQLAAGRADLEAIAALGEVVEGPLSLSISPALVEVAAAADPAFGERLRAALAGDEALALPAYELDPSAVVAIGDQAALTRTLSEGEDVLDRILPATPTQRSAWIMDRPLSRSAAEGLRDLGFRLLVVDDDVYATLPGNIAGYTDTTLVIAATLSAGNALPALVTTASASLLDPATADERSPADRAIRVAAELLALRADFDPLLRRAAVLATSDLAVPDPAVVAVFARIVDQSPDLRLVALSALPGAASTMDVAGQQVSVELPVAAGVDLASRADAIARTRIAAQDAASMLPAADPRPARWLNLLDTLLSTALGDADVSGELATIDAETAALRRAVVPPAPFTFTLTGRSDELRLRIGNDTDTPLRVIVRASSPKLTFPDGDQLVTLSAGELTNVELPVRARSNGTSSVAVEILTPAGGSLVTPITLTAHVTALTGLGQVITGGAALMLVAWWGSHLRRSRLRRRAANGGPAPLVSPGDALPAVSPDAAEATAHPPSGSVPPP